MIIGRSLRYQDSDLLCRMYYCGDREVFEFYREYDKSIPVSRREHPFLESLLLFLEMDHASDFPQLNQIESDLTEYSIYKEQQYAENALQELQELSKRHIYYEILNMACSQQIRNANNCHDQPLDVLNGLLLISRNLNMYMFQTHQFLEHVLDIDRAGRHPKDQMQQLYEHDVGGDAFSFRFHPIPISYELVKEGQIVPVLYSSNILDIIEFALRTCVEREITVRRCKNCGRYFARIGRGKVEYCGRSPAKGQATCRKTGAFQQWTIKQKDNPIFKVYRKEYKKRFAWIKAGRITAEAFYCWSRQAREKRDECKQGQLSLEEFQAWLKKED